MGLLGCVVGGLGFWGYWLLRGAYEVQGREHAQAREQLAGLQAVVQHKETRLREQEERLAASAREREEAQQKVVALEAQFAALRAQGEERLAQAQEQLKQMAAMREELSERFEALSAQSLQKNNQTFLDLARSQLKEAREQQEQEQQRRSGALKDMVSPLKEALEQVQGHVHALEKSRSAAYAGLTEQVKQLLEAQRDLRSETGNLVQALRTPHVRGQWGELQLERVVELAGMLEYCDFSKQVTAKDEKGLLRPDLLVRLPNGRNIVVDAKAPLLAYLEAIELPEGPEREAALKTHARHIRDHIVKLSSKGYWKQFSPSPEFVVLFIPGEVFFSAALEQDPELLQFGITEKVILATPTTLIALLKAVAYGWQQAGVAQQAQAISQLGRELYERLHVLGSHFTSMGKQLDRTVESYNKTLRCAQTRVFVTARKLKALPLSKDTEMPEPEVIEKRPLSALELQL